MQLSGYYRPTHNDACPNAKGDHVEGGLSASANEVAKERHKELDSKLDAPVVRAKKKLLHCPQDEEADASQDDMDKQFASFD